ncbi:MAG TPA: hypothetical protein VI796_00825, partial [Candidatus Thermoplasmatota archaeon]|nr:hypothetical protein [Candidatus Thermoplasmatota archaeon]
MDGTCGNCGGTLQGNPGETVRCGACGTSMAMPPPETGRFAAILAKADPVASLKRNWFLLLFAATFGWIDWTMHRSVVFVVVLANVALVLALFGNVLAAAVGLPRYTARFPRRWVPLVFAMVPLLYYALRAFGSFQDRLPIFLTTLGIVLLTIVAGPSLDQRLEPFYARRNRSLPGWSRRLAVPLLCFLATTLIIFGNFDGVTAMFGASPGAPPGESSLRLRTLLGGVLAATLAFLLLREADPAGRRRAAGASPLAHIVVPFVVAAMVALMVTLPHADAQGNGTAPYNPAPTYDPWTAPTTDPYTAPASPAYEPPAYNPYTPPPYDPYATPTYPAYQPPSPSAPLQPDPSDAASASPSLGEVTFECDPVASGEMASVTNSLCSQGDAIAALLNKGAKEGCYSDGDLAALDHQASQFYATLRTYPGLVGDTGLGAAQSMSRANSCSAGFAVAAAPAFIGAAAVAVAALPPPPIQVDPTAGREMRPYQGGRRFGSDAAQGDPSSARGPIRDREYLAEDPGAGGARLSTDMPEGPPPIGANPSESHALDAMPGRDPNPLVRAATGGEGGAIGGSAPPPPGYTGRGYSVDTGRQFQADSGPSSDIRLNPSQAQSLDTGRPVGTPAPDRSLDNPYAPPSPRGLPPPIGSDAPQD